MFTCKIDFKCKLCDNTQNWYIMPVDIKAGNSYVHSLNDYRVVCKKCGQDYILSFKIKLLKRKSNG